MTAFVFGRRPRGVVDNPVEFALVAGTVGTLPADVSAGTFAQVWSISSASETGLFAGHVGSIYMPARRAMWFFGAETHGNVNNYANSPWHIDLDTGNLYRDHAHSAFPGEYRIDAAGVPWADAAKTKPWATHAMRHMTRTSTDEWVLAYSTRQHEYYFDTNNPVYEGAIEKANYTQGLWFYNTASGTWRFEGGGASNANLKGFNAESVGRGVVYSSARGSIMGNMAGTWKELNLTTFARESSSPSITASGVNSYAILLDDGRVIVDIGGTQGNTTLCAIVDPTAPASFTTIAKADVAVLSGYSCVHTAWAKLGDGRVVGFAKDLANGQLRAVIFDPTDDSWTDTGHTLSVTATGAADSLYWLMCDWADEFGCVILANNFGGTRRVWAYKPSA